MLSAVAIVSTNTAGRYAKQLLSHLGHKARALPLPGFEAPAGRLIFRYGIGTVVPRGADLVLTAYAASDEDLAHVEDVLARHLIKFGARAELTVEWQQPQQVPDDDVPVAADDDAAEPEAKPAPAPVVRVLHTDSAPSHQGPVPQAVEAGGWIYVSALFGATPDTHTIPEDATAEAEQVFANLDAILTAAGLGRANVVRVGIVMRDIRADRPTFNEVWKNWFGDHRPARSAIQAADFGRTGENARFLIEVTAFRG